MNKALAILLIWLCAAPITQAQVAAPTPRDDLWAPNQNVAAAREHRGVLYLTGAFTKIGMPTGGFALTDPLNGDPAQRFGAANGEIEVVEPDGAGGWWVGGRIRTAYGAVRGGAVHVLQDGTLDAWDPGLSTSVTVLDIASDATSVYMVGSFGVMRVDAQTGQSLAWSAIFDVDPNTVELAQDKLVVAGHFSTVNGQPREGLAAFVASTGELIEWAPLSDGTVAKARVHGDSVYVAGQFSIPGSPLSSHSRVANFDLLSGLHLGLDIPVNGGGVDELAANDEVVFVGGSFTEVNGHPRHRVAAIDALSGAVRGWAPVLTASGGGVPRVHGISADADRVYLVGEFERADGQDAYGAAAFDIASGSRSPWDPRLGSTSARDVYTTGQDVAIVGSFRIVRAMDRNYVAALDLTTGLPTDFHPPVGRNETAILPAGDAVYIGTGMYDAKSGAPDAAFAPTVVDFVSRLHRIDETLYAVGSGPSGFGVFAMDASTGDHRWYLDGPSRVNHFTASQDGRFLYLAGGFSTVAGGLARPGIAEVDTIKQRFTDWSPDLSRNATGVATIDTRIFVSGDFRTANSEQRPGLAVFEITDEKSRSLSSYDAQLDNPVGALTANGELLYLWGSFRNIGAEWREGIAAVHNSTAQLCTWEVHGASRWAPFPDAGPNTIVFRSDAVVFGTLYHPYFCVFDIVPGQACK